MVRVDQAIIARLKKEGDTFEILVDCDKALAYREGKLANLSEVLATKEIFKDAKKGIRASENEMKKLFKTDKADAIAEIIIKKGEIQITAEHRNKLREEKRKQIVAFIHRNAVDAKTGHPHPPQRIETLMEEAKIKIDEFHSVEMQVQDVITKLRPLIPIKMEVRELELLIPVKHAEAAFGHVKRTMKILKEQWGSDGSLKVIVEIPAGIQEEIEQQLNKITKGEVEITIINKR
ncbi:ribosome assembly factor SBDS [Candidatus Woesearchaeota archaeon]|nr:ribosome assembly factor SBDS [Candidatus Woesearchaeota archaeon]